jgi:hypothetical protein
MPKMYYAMYQDGGFSSPKSHFKIHAFKTEKSRNYFINNMNAIYRERYNVTSTVAIAVTVDDIYVKKALDDVKNNPIVYNNKDYINSRIYIEHDETL